MIRILSGLVAGMTVALLVIVGVQAIAYAVVPLPGLDDSQPVGLDRPVGLLLFDLFAWALGVVLGSAIAVRTARRPWTAWVIAGAIGLAALFRFAMITHPAWFMVASLPVIFAGGWAGLRLQRIWLKSG